MAKSPRVSPSSDAGKPTGLAALRAQIDRIDRELVGLMNARAEVARQIGHIKKSSGQETYDPSREEMVLERVTATNQGPLSADSLKAVYRELISGSRAIEQPLRVAHLGPAWTYSHLAALHRFGSSVEFVPVASISAAFEEVHAGHSHYGVVPLENSTDGRIADTLDNFSRLPVKICAEVPLRIHHTLLAACDRSAITEVYSRPQALSQCRNWLARHLPAARLVEVTSTSLAAETAREDRGRGRQHDPLRRHRPCRRQAHRQGQDGDHVRDRAPTRRPGRRPLDPQEAEAQSDLDRIVPAARHGAGLHLLR
ncbi:MAG: chorismate mutase [Planctomycetaceae bacterium]|nr:chorismate mutase [Planctomycetaceae bacterium]